MRNNAAQWRTYDSEKFDNLTTLLTGIELEILQCLTYFMRSSIIIYNNYNYLYQYKLQ